MKLDSLWAWEVEVDDFLVIRGETVKVTAVHDLVDSLKFDLVDEDDEPVDSFVTGPFEGVLHVTSFETDEDEMFTAIGMTWEDE